MLYKDSLILLALCFLTITWQNLKVPSVIPHQTYPLASKLIPLVAEEALLSREHALTLDDRNRCCIVSPESSQGDYTAHKILYSACILRILLMTLTLNKRPVLWGFFFNWNANYINGRAAELAILSWRHDKGFFFFLHFLGYRLGHVCNCLKRFWSLRCTNVNIKESARLNKMLFKQYGHQELSVPVPFFFFFLSSSRARGMEGSCEGGKGRVSIKMRPTLS